MPGYPLINGQDYSFASITVKVGNTPFFPTAIDYNDSLTPGRVYKSGSAVPAGATRGQWDGASSLEFTVADFAAFQAGLAVQQVAQAVAGIALVVFSVQVVYSEAGLGVITDTLPAVRLMTGTNTPGGGSDPSKVKVDLFLLKPILRNGVPLISDAPQVA